MGQVGPGQEAANLTGRIGSALEVFKSHRSGRFGSEGFRNLAGRVGSGQEMLGRVGPGQLSRPGPTCPMRYDPTREQLWYVPGFIELASDTRLPGYVRWYQYTTARRSSVPLRTDTAAVRVLCYATGICFLPSGRC